MSSNKVIKKNFLLVAFSLRQYFPGIQLFSSYVTHTHTHILHTHTSHTYTSHTHTSHTHTSHTYTSHTYFTHTFFTHTYFTHTHTSHTRILHTHILHTHTTQHTYVYTLKSLMCCIFPFLTINMYVRSLAVMPCDLHSVDSLKNGICDNPYA